MNLFLDTSNGKLLFILEKDNKIIDSLLLVNKTKISDIFSDTLSNFLNKNKLSLKQIEAFYLTIGPGSYTGVRVGVTFVKTIFAINPKIEVFTISSLQFQAGMEKSISILDARSNISYVGIYENGQNLIPDQLLPNDIHEEFFKNFLDFQLIYDYNLIVAERYFILLKNNFNKINNINNLNPIYIKGFM